MLDQEPDHTLMRSEWRSMDAERNFFIAFLVRELQIEARRNGKINLVRGEREFTPDGTPDLHIDLRSIERGFVFRFHIRDATVHHGSAHHLFRLDPQTLVIYVLFAKTGFAMQTQAHHKFIETEQLEVTEVHIHYSQKLLFELVFRNIDMSIVHLHRADAHQAKQLA